MMAECEQSTTLDELSDWLLDEENQVETSEHTALSAHIDRCPICSQRVSSLRQLTRVTSDLKEHDLAEQTQDTGWLDTILSNIVFETRSGRSIPLASDFEQDSLSVTEGAVIAAVRSAADTLDDVLIGKCRLHGDLETLGAPVTVEVTASLRSGGDRVQSTIRLRELIVAELARVSEMNVEKISIEFNEFFESTGSSEDPAKLSPAESGVS
ncbi:hypothetical protein [Rothia aerolata]|uniref:Asp23/Gls24 family envelope stress response protein n=1 Tax=Rothia aerolata TaxID=1812262 RepID=A0A917ISQ9_9MICC|nr:hypothetical protein [Rothia aerolata]GGH62200.1 hypothetical protein GCM10007359_12200 [Rothia aerolata]